ncbi:MAG: sugar phosphate isomerase/epimerase [Actinomycetota bacterium]|nr:sugar phosphate isomerase/epimerase [Actinomycetota bacterium]
MKLGMNMLLWSTDVSGPEYAPIFEMLRDAGYDGIEVPIFGGADVGELARLGERLDALGLVPLGVTARSEADSPISPDPQVRARALAATKVAIDGCAALGAKTLCGPIEAPLGVFSGTGPTDEERARSVEYLRAAAEYAAGRDVTLVVEYLNRFEMYLVNCAADAAALVRAVDHPNCRLMYDTFHAHIEEKDPRAALHECADVLVHFHASENDRGTPGAGQVAWDATFDALHEIGYDGWVVIEAFGDALPDLAAATKIWRRMFSSEEQLARDGAAFVRERWAATAATTAV